MQPGPSQPQSAVDLAPPVEPGGVVDVVIVGGGAAGLGAAVTLARSRRSVVVIDAGAPRNAPADGVHGLLGHEGVAPLALLARGREEARGYGAVLVEGEVTEVACASYGFVVSLRNGDVLHGRRLLIATGLVDELPDIPGVRERWGRDVLHCPYCHGWEVRDRRIGVIASGPMSVHQALMFRQLSAQVVFFAQQVELAADDRARLAARGIPLVSGDVAAVQIRDDRIVGVLVDDGQLVDVEVVVVGPRMVARADLFAGIGIEPTAHPVGSFIETDQFGATSVSGVWAAGNSADLAAQVGGAAAAGVRAAQHINGVMVMEDADRAVTQRGSEVIDSGSNHGGGHASAHTFDKDYWEQHWRARPGAAPGEGDHRTDRGTPNPEVASLVNPHLVREITDLSPGSALDAGSGAGVEAIWLASNGWEVTAADISAVALHRATAFAAATEAREVTGRIRWVEADLEAWEPGRTFDLVTTHYAHPAMPQLDFYQRIASWVAPGGTLLIVGHLGHGDHGNHGHDQDRHEDQEPPRKATATATAITARLHPDVWEVVTAEEVSRTVGIPGGGEKRLHDVVVRARRIR